MGITGALQPLRKRPDPKQPRPLGSRIFFRLAAQSASPGALAHARAIGSPTVAPPPGNLVHARAFGALQVASTSSAALRLVHRGARSVVIAELTTPRVLFFLEAQLALPGNLVHVRALGSPAARIAPTPASLAHTRALGQPQLQVVPNPTLLSLTHGRFISEPNVIALILPPPSPAAPPGQRTLRAVYRYAARRRGWL